MKESEEALKKKYEPKYGALDINVMPKQELAMMTVFKC